MSTPLSEFREPLRHLLGDRDPATYQYSDANLDVGTRTVVRMGLVEGYSMTADLLSVTPAVTDANAYALLLYQTVKSFVASQPDSYSYRTRALSEQFRGARDFVSTLELNIHELKNGTMFMGWQQFAGWFASLTGTNPWENLISLELDAPTQTMTFGSDGLSSS